jgi:peptidoglycan/xylan/chitin deacetylase (PgdA/CDA1 family)
MKRELLARGRAALYRFAPVRPLVRRLRPRALVLVYHRVAAVSLDPFRLAVSPVTFDRHLHLLRRRFHVTALPALVASLATGDYTDETVAVTFDDGYEDNLRLAYPIAARHATPFTVFVTVAAVLDQQRWFWWDELGARIGPAETRAALHAELKGVPPAERRARLDALPSPAPELSADTGRPLTPSELFELAGRPGVTIGAHTMTHPSLGRVCEHAQADELRRSRQRLEQPGDVSAITRRVAREAGYTAAFTTERAVVTPGKALDALPRLTVYDWSDEEFLKRVESLFRAA